MGWGEWTSLVILILLLGASAYLIYQIMPGTPIQLERTDNVNPSIDFGQENANYSQSQQFYLNMRFPESDVTYYFEPECSIQKKESMNEAFEILAEKTPLSFSLSPNEESANIVITCSQLAPEPKLSSHFVAGEGGPTEIVNTTLFSVIRTGKISVYRNERCDSPQIATHELLHVLGFDHNDDPRSILYPTLDCAQEIDQYLIDELQELYELPSKPDLAIQRIEATKSGRYLDFEIEIINRGLKDVDDMKLSVYADDDLVQVFDLNSSAIGTRKTFTVTNLGIGRSTDNVAFIIDEENSVDELFENNNEALLRLTD